MQIGYFLGNMGYVILQKWLFAVRFLVVWVLQSPCFDPTFDPNLTLTRFFACQKSLFRFHLDHQKTPPFGGRFRGILYPFQAYFRGIERRFSYNYIGSVVDGVL